MMRVLVCLPSLNEAKTIGNVTKIVDKGLQSIHGITGALIVNVDSRSSDGTGEVFSTQDTFYPKLSIVPEGKRGKGRNLIEFAKLAIAENADFCATVDSDITSATDDWMARLLGPLIRREADYVTPLYERSRFEGSTTNHFAYPVVYGFTGLRIRQPIAGDSAFNQKFLAILTSKEPPGVVFEYGIDPFLVLTAATSSLRIKQVELGKKIHAPSFNKLEFMFPQMAASALTVIRQLTSVALAVQPQSSAANILESNVFLHRIAALEMLDRARNKLKILKPEECPWLQGPSRSSILASILEKPDQNQTGYQNLWIDILVSWLKYGLEHGEVDVVQLSNELLPFFVVRAVQFWFRTEILTAQETEQEIHDQADALKIRLLTLFHPAA